MVGSIHSSVETVGNADREPGDPGAALSLDATEAGQAWRRQLAADGSNFGQTTKTVQPEGEAGLEPRIEGLPAPGEPGTVKVRDSAENANPLNLDVNAVSSRPRTPSGDTQPGRVDEDPSAVRGALREDPLRARPSASHDFHLEPLRRSRTPVGDGARAADAADPRAGRFNLFSGRILNEFGNVLAEASTLSGVDEAGVVGEVLFAAGGASQAWEEIRILLLSGSPRQNEDLLRAGVEFVRGIGNLASGTAGIAGFRGYVAASKASSGIWSFTEGLNALTQAYDAVKAGNELTPQQRVRVAAVIGSVLKCVGAAASTRVPGHGPVIAQVVGTVISTSSGLLNLHSKHIDASLTAKEYRDNLMGALRKLRGQRQSEPVSGQFNPDAHQMV
jgi:hypothetical protein